MLRPILRYGAPTLHTPAVPVASIDESVMTLLDDMAETMYAAPGIGLAAPQVGVALRIFVVDLSVGKDSKELIELLNPEFVLCEGMQIEEEGCLSLPGFNATVVRPERAVVRGLDRFGRERTVDGSGLLARALQHEMDHLDGALFVQRLRGIRRELILRRVQRLRRTGQW
jgi:peptide deformylase